MEVINKYFTYKDCTIKSIPIKLKKHRFSFFSKAEPAQKYRTEFTNNYIDEYEFVEAITKFVEEVGDKFVSIVPLEQISEKYHPGGAVGPGFMVRKGIFVVLYRGEKE